MKKKKDKKKKKLVVVASQGRPQKLVAESFFLISTFFDFHMASSSCGQK